MHKFTFDTIHRDSFPRQFLIRYATPKEIESGDVFETLKECRNSLSKVMVMDIFLCVNILEK